MMIPRKQDRHSLVVVEGRALPYQLLLRSKDLAVDYIIVVSHASALYQLLYRYPGLVK